MSSTLSRDLRALFELVRLPNIFTAPADVAMGMSVSAASFAPPVAVPLLAASAFAYAGGMALNDAWDAPLDARERPERPIPSGRIARTTAFKAAGGCFVLCVGLAALAGPAPLVVAVLLVVAIVLYDGFAKGSAAGPGAMAACRALNAGLGVAVGAAGSRALSAVGLLFAYVVVLTVLSRFEVMAAPVALVRAGAAAFAIVLLVTGALLVLGEGPSGLVGIPFLLALALWLGAPLRSALSEPSPPRIIAVIKAAVLGIILFDAAWVGGTESPAAGLAVALLFVPAFALGRRFASA